MRAHVAGDTTVAAWFEYRAAGEAVTRTEPLVLAAGDHDLAQRSRRVPGATRYRYRVVARTLDATARGRWLVALGSAPHGGPPNPPPVPTPKAEDD